MWDFDIRIKKRANIKQKQLWVCVFIQKQIRIIYLKSTICRYCTLFITTVQFQVFTLRRNRHSGLLPQVLG